MLASSLAAQAIFDYAPEADRARRILSKLRQTPRLIQAARDNVKEPPAIFIKVGVDTLRGVMTFIDRDLPRAFHSLDDLHLLADLADASTEAVQAIGSYIDYLETDVRPRAKASFRLGTGSLRAEAAARRRHLAVRPIACSRLPSANCATRRKNSARWPAG